MSQTSRLGVASALLVLAFGCTQETPQSRTPAVAEAPAATATSPASPRPLEVEPVATPAPSGSAEPFLATAKNGDILLSWLEPVAGSKKHALRFARFAGNAWSEPRTIVEREDLFVNWADFPSVVEDGSGTLFAHWLQKSGGDTYSYDVRMAASRDGGATWGESFLLNRDGKKSEHGFVSLVALDSGVAAAWLDGRNMMPGHGHHAGDMTLRYARVGADGTLSDEVELDGRTCECCTTGMTMTADGPVIVYRDRSAEEIRDISFVTRSAGGWSKPANLHPDGWKIAGCPVNGPQIDAAGTRVATAWFSAAEGKSHVYAAWSSDGGRTFGAPVTLDDGRPLGRVDVVMLDDSRALVTWLEQTAADGEVRARIVPFEGTASPSKKIADSGSARGSGFARLTRSAEAVWIAWTAQEGEAKQVRVARIRV